MPCKKNMYVYFFFKFTTMHKKTVLVCKFRSARCRTVFFMTHLVRTGTKLLDFLLK